MWRSAPDWGKDYANVFGARRSSDVCTSCITGEQIIGTLAGAAAISETMVVGGAGDASPGASALRMAPGLGLLSGVVVDSHFAHRRRFGRLLGAVAQNPANLGLGLDDNTAVVVEQGRKFCVLGWGAAYVLDGSSITYSGLSEAHAEGVSSIHGVNGGTRLLQAIASPGDKVLISRNIQVRLL
jgi:cyanophycinase